MQQGTNGRLIDLRLTFELLACLRWVQAMSVGDEVIVHKADLDLIAVCRKVNFDFAETAAPTSTV